MNVNESKEVVPPKDPALQAAAQVSELDPGAFNRALKIYLAKRGYRMKLCQPPADSKGNPLYGLHRRYPARSRPLAKMTMPEWRRWFLDGGHLDELRQNR